ncbi:hypothetical protein HT102_03905 [Hoyosella sp. G463]|uniref:Uncharacterized protein n=1 Tax=Lolliginicoccus lacisalsi TaxID=2742202 RepID=A0A927JAL5_9ACTN|nr:hypothetical protein [Lolliginicoccus lacisalsi]MBD8505630.1 hypothetical protein [Lolliginicoccus lacisalsi]
MAHPGHANRTHHAPPNRLKARRHFAVLAAALLAASCASTPDEAPEASTEPTTETTEAQPVELRELNSVPVDVPGSLFRAGEFAGRGLDLLPPSENAPYAVALNMAAPGRSTRPVVWVADNGEAWTPVEVAPDYPHAFSGGLVGNEAVSAVVGTAFEEGSLVSRIWRSTDRRGWSAVPLPPEYANEFRVVTGTVTATKIITAGNSLDKEIGVAIVEGDSIEYTLLPGIPDREQRLIVDMAAHGDTVVLIAQRGDEGAAGTFVSYTSSDAGSTWDGPHPIGSSNEMVISGVESIGDQFVMTGGTLNPQAERGQVPAAWSSGDGAEWNAETVPAPPAESVFYVAEGVDTTLGRPSARGGDLFAVASNNDSLRAGFYHRTADGQWFFNGVSEPMDFPGVGGVVLGMNPEQRAVLLGSFAVGEVVMGVKGPGEEWREVQRVGTSEQVAQVEDIVSAAGRVLATTLQVRYEIDGADFSSSEQRDLLELRGGTAPEDPLVLAPITLDPPEVAGLIGGVVSSTDADEIIALGSQFSLESNRIEARGWFQPANDQPWIPVEGFGAVADASLAAVTRTDEAWYAVGTSTGPEADQPPTATVWSSPDGRGWTMEQILGGSDEGSAASAVCQIGGGPVLVAGSTLDGGASVPAIWRKDTDGWTRATADILGSGQGELTGCAASDEEAVLSATTGGRNIVLRTEDGIEFEGTFRTGFGATMREPVRVAGGFAAAGRYTSNEASGPVVWLSEHGARWEPWRVPSRSDGLVRAVQPFRDGIAITMDSEVGHPVQVVEQLDFAPNGGGE